jgi:hypothetical protein
MQPETAKDIFVRGEAMWRGERRSISGWSGDEPRHSCFDEGGCLEAAIIQSAVTFHLTLALCLRERKQRLTRGELLGGWCVMLAGQHRIEERIANRQWPIANGKWGRCRE